jgi:signal transduction histidine kinase
MPHNEAARLEALRQCDILDTAPEPAFDDITRLAAHICGTPIALTTLIEVDRQWFKAKVGLAIAETSRNVSFCAHAILQPDLLIVPDALADARFATNPLVTAEPHIRFYAGAPLVTPEGHALGTLCVIDRMPRELSPDQQEALRALAREVMAQLQLRKANAALESRTRELNAANVQLEQAMQQVAEGSRHTSEFLANMSHEIRTPLNSIIGFSELLQDQLAGTLSEKHARFLTHIYKSGKHLLSLINDILDLSKVEAGKLTLQPEPLHVASTLEDILFIGRGLAHRKAQTVETKLEPNLPPLHADPVRFKQILYNLLSNAVKFTPDGGRITVRAYAPGGVGDGETGGMGERESGRSGDATQLAIEITDTGAGIRAEDLPRLFREFAQLETTRAQRHEGTGLGLALTKRLVELHGGRVWAESEGEGRGSAFTVLLPFGGSGASQGASAEARPQETSGLDRRHAGSPASQAREGIRLPLDRRLAGRPRFPVQVIALTEAGDTRSDPERGEAQDLSRGGMLLRLEKTIAPRTQVRITMLFTRRPPLTVEGMVVWVQPHPILPGWALGIRFSEELPGEMVAEIASEEHQS